MILRQGTYVPCPLLKTQLMRIFFILTMLALTLSCATMDKISGKRAKERKNICIEYYNIAEGFMNIKEYAKAATYFKKAMRDKELYPTAYYELGRAYALGKNWEKAKAIFSEYLEKDPDNLDLQMSVAYVVAMKGDFSEALEKYKALIEKNPDSAELQKNFIALLLSCGRAEMAEEEFSHFKEHFPDDSDISDIKKKIAIALGEKVEDEPKEKGDDKKE